jgi:hypothetical protein
MRNTLISFPFGMMLIICGFIWNDTASGQTGGPRTIDQMLRAKIDPSANPALLGDSPA